MFVYSWKCSRFIYFFQIRYIWSRNLNIDFTISNCLFGTVKVTKNADPDKYGCSGYGTGFDAHSKLSWADG